MLPLVLKWIQAQIHSAVNEKISFVDFTFLFKASEHLRRLGLLFDSTHAQRKNYLFAHANFLNGEPKWSSAIAGSIANVV